MSVQTKLDHATTKISLHLKQMPSNFTKVTGTSPVRDEHNLIRRLICIYLGSCYEVNNSFYKEFKKCATKETAALFLHILRLNQCLVSDLTKLLGSTWKLDNGAVESAVNYSKTFGTETLSLKDLSRHTIVWIYFQIFISEIVFKEVNQAILRDTKGKFKLGYYHAKWILENKEIKNATHKGRVIPKFRREQLEKLKSGCELLFEDILQDGNSYFDDILDAQVKVFTDSLDKVSDYGTDLEV